MKKKRYLAVSEIDSNAIYSCLVIQHTKLAELKNLDSFYMAV